MALEQHKIIMNFSLSPSLEDIEVIAKEVCGILPEEILENCEDLIIRVEDFPDEALQSELDLEGPYDLVALFRSGKEISPGVQRKVADEDDVLFLFRRPILDLWCETNDDLSGLIREIMIEELGQNFEFSEDDIEEMTRRHHQGMF